MRLTNKYGLPQPIYDAVANDPYTKGDADYSITGLLKPPRIAQLERVHSAEIEEDASDRIFSLIGQVAHGILERSERVAIAEKRLYMEIDGVRISGQTDRFVYQSGLLQDYKVTSVWKVMKKLDVDWVRQQNAYKFLLEYNGFTCNKAEIVAIFRDWKKSQARTEEAYPVAQVQIVDIPLWDSTDTVRFLRERIRLHEEAKKVLPRCSSEEQWAVSDSWAVMKKGGKRAVKIYYDEESAKEHVAAFAEDGYTIVFRRGLRRRCVDYCRVSSFCEQYKEETAAQE